MSSVDIRVRLPSHKCFIAEKTLSTYALLHGIENKNEIILWKLGEGVDLTNRSIAHNWSGLISLIHFYEY